MHGSEKEPTLVGSFDLIHDKALDCFSRKQFAEAEALCLQARNLQPNDVGILNLLGQIFLAQDRPFDATESFSRAIQIEPTLPNLHFNLALARQAEGRIDQAILATQEAIKLDPKVPVLHAKLGQLLSASNSPAEAVIVLRHALKLDSMSVPIRLNLAQALTDLGQMEEAEKVTRAAHFLNPKDSTAHRMLGRLHQLNGDFALAVTCFETSIALQPAQSAAYFALAYSKPFCTEDISLLKQMEGLLDTSLDDPKDQTLLHYALGKGLDDLGEFESAIEHFIQANRLALDSMKSTGQAFDRDSEAERVNSRIEHFPSKVFDKPKVESSPSKRPIFIVGMIRSGTTLVEQILSRHPDVCAGGELRYWFENELAMFDQWVNRPQDETVISSWLLNYEAELDRVSASALRVTDKMPFNYWALGLIHLAYPGAKIIHCRRNPLDTCLSIFTTPFRRAPSFGHDLENIVNAYAEYQRLMAHWRAVIPDSHLIEVDYEELVTDPESNTRELIQFIDLEWHDACLDPKQNAGPVNTPSQWQVRQPVYRNSVARWQNYAEFLKPALRLLQGSDFQPQNMEAPSSLSRNNGEAV